MTQSSGSDENAGTEHEDAAHLGEVTPEEQATKNGIPNPATGAGIGATGPNSFEPEEAEPPS